MIAPTSLGLHEYAPNRSELAAKYIEEFGRINGSAFFTEGLSWSEAITRHCELLRAGVEALEAENAQLRQKLAFINLLNGRASDLNSL